MPRLTLLFACIAATALVSVDASAQCPGPDNLAGPCCNLTTANLPLFPAVSMPAETLCWENCDVISQACAQVKLSPPTQLSCGEFVVDMELIDCSGLPLFKAGLHLDYTRTWDEILSTAQDMQVWRFVVKADFVASTPPAGNCPIPSCFSAYSTAFYYGYVDYALDCATGNWQSSLVLYHGCDKYQHDPFFSDRPGTFHPKHTFAVVAPTTSANPFLPALATAPGGIVASEAMRVTPTPGSPICEVGERAVQGSVVALGKACICPFSIFPAQTTAREVEVIGACNSTTFSLNTFPTSPWFHTMTNSIGTWTTPANYPGPEAAWVDEGVFLRIQSCGPGTTPTLFVEIKYGGTTDKGYLAVSPTGGIESMTDMVDNYSVKIGTPILPPFVGSLRASHHMFYLNPM